jgi:pimeloyl-ACP methyl ester carboxylesterase
VVDYLRALRGVEKVHLVGWSLGGPRAGGYTARNPAKVASLVLLAPAYMTGSAPGTPRDGAPFNAQSRADFDANWDRQLGCANQYEPSVREGVWREMLASDTVGATWGTGVRRAPNVAMHSWNRQVVSAMTVPALFVAAALDKQALPDRVKALYTDYGASAKVLLDLGCASHNALWERNRLLLFQASLDWFSRGEVKGSRSGVVQLGQ